MRTMTVVLMLAILQGCKATQEQMPPAPAPVIQHVYSTEQKSPPLCIVPRDVESFVGQCDIGYWVRMWVEADAMRWPQRKALLAELGTSLPDTLKKIVLSLPTDTPYQDRLRAQNYLTEIQSVLNPQVIEAVNTLVSRPNTQLLEFESAITLLSRVNTQQAQSMENLREELEAQRKQIEELLQIEATLMDKNRSTQQ
ncbi:hypothetical protein DXV75_11550 [Alteromonas aestuariivivens]|uniref:Uncharacterized protein n=1 Tax=Alteromonas aestuariivivens TaxID=1938339 RepID=A0A3D8M6H8_9ALTE|nr:hypothetical protein [Alteromonas aestuariivivens]RDV25231.1 hypothetical protein DXV75_11550 [Alteromonas aestuariivivens]